MGISENVTVNKTNIRNPLFVIKFKLIYLDKKSSITKVYLGTCWYNKSCIKALLTPDNIKLIPDNTRITFPMRINY